MVTQTPYRHLDEARPWSDRAGQLECVAVMHEGRIAGILDRGQFSEENVLLLAVGKTLDAEISGVGRVQSKVPMAAPSAGGRPE